MGERTNKVIKGNCDECQFEPENGHAHTCSKRESVGVRLGKKLVQERVDGIESWKVLGFTEKLFGKPVKKNLL